MAPKVPLWNAGSELNTITKFCLFACLPLSACSGAHKESDASPNPLAVTAQAPISADERKKIVDAATSGLELERDNMERISFYTNREREILSTKLEAYLSVPDATPAILRIRPMYYGTDWIFFDHIKVMADDEVIYEQTIENPIRDNGSGSVWETADYAVRLADLAAMRRIAAAKSVTIRFYGRERRKDHEMTPSELKNLREILAAFDAMANLSAPSA